MTSMPSAIAALDWPAITAHLDQEGWAVLPGLAGHFQEIGAAALDAIYPRLAPIAERWHRTLGKPLVRPIRAHAHAFVLREGEHRDMAGTANGELVFPLQLAALTSEPGLDFTGGEYVLVEQRPRMQSRPIVLPLRRGDAALIATADRPHPGSHGHYRVRMKHAISRVRSGARRGFEVVFEGR